MLGKRIEGFKTYLTYSDLIELERLTSRDILETGIMNFRCRCSIFRQNW